MMIWALLLDVAFAHPPAHDPIMEACNGKAETTVRVQKRVSGELMLVTAHGGVAGDSDGHPPPASWVRSGDPRLRAELLDGPRGNPVGIKPVTILERTTAPHRAQLLLRVEGLPEAVDSYVWLQRKTILGWRRVRSGPHSPFRRRFARTMRPAPHEPAPLEPIRSGRPPRPGLVACSFTGSRFGVWSGVSVVTIPPWAHAALVTFDSPTASGTVERVLYTVDMWKRFVLPTTLPCDGSPAVTYPTEGTVHIEYMDGRGRRSPAQSITLGDLPSCGQLTWGEGESREAMAWKCAQRKAHVLERAEPGTLAVAGLEPGEAYDWLCPLGPSGLAPFQHYTCPDGLGAASRQASLFWVDRRLRAQYEQLGSVSGSSLDDGDPGDGPVPPEVRAAVAAEPPEAPPPSAPPPPWGWRVVDGAAMGDDCGLALLEFESPTGPVRVVQAWRLDYPGDWIPGRGLPCGAGEVRFLEMDGEVWTTQLVGDALSWGRWSVVSPPVPGRP